MTRSFALSQSGGLNQSGWLSKMASIMAIGVALGSVVSIAAACPKVTSRLPFDGRDGQISQNIGGAVAGFPVRAADDFLLEIGNGNP